MFVHIWIFFLALDVKFFKDSQIIHFAKIDPHFFTSTLRWFFLFSQLIVDYEILPMCNYLLICKKKLNIRFIKLKSYIIIIIIITIKGNSCHYIWWQPDG
jgi:hypothetical protein